MLKKNKRFLRYKYVKIYWKTSAWNTGLKEKVAVYKKYWWRRVLRRRLMRGNKGGRIIGWQNTNYLNLPITHNKSIRTLLLSTFRIYTNTNYIYGAEFVLEDLEFDSEDLFNYFYL